MANPADNRRGDHGVPGFSNGDDELALAPGNIVNDTSWFFATSISRLSTAVTRALDAGMRDLGLTGTQVSALYFARYTRPQFATVGNLARTLGVSHVTVVRSIRPLIERGLLRREPGSDRRTTLLAITELGEEAVGVAFRERHALLREVASEFSEADAQRIAELLLDLAHLLTGNANIGTYGPCELCSRVGTEGTLGGGEGKPSYVCSAFDVGMTPAEMKLGCPHFEPVGTQSGVGEASSATRPTEVTSLPDPH